MTASSPGTPPAPAPNSAAHPVPAPRSPAPDPATTGLGPAGLNATSLDATSLDATSLDATSLDAASLANLALISPAPTFPPAAAQTAVPRLGVLASGSGTNFGALMAAIAAGQVAAEVPVLIYNQPTAAVVQRAEQWQVPTQLLNHRHYDDREDFDRAIVAALQAAQVDWVIMAGWMRIVTPVLIHAFPHRIINIHPSLLPSFKGVKAVEQALAAGVKVTGCTVHLVVPEVDSGPILMQAVVPILPNDTPETLHQRIQVQEHRILPAAIAWAIAQ